MTALLRRSLLLIAASPVLLYVARTHRFTDAPALGGGAATHSVARALVVFVAFATLVLGTWLAVVALREYFRDERPMDGALLATVIAEGCALTAVRAYVYAGSDTGAAGAAAHGAKASGKGAAILALFFTVAVLAGAAMAMHRVRRILE
jgi:hypothetical protein